MNEYNSEPAAKQSILCDLASPSRQAVTGSLALMTFLFFFSACGGSSGAPSTSTAGHEIARTDLAAMPLPQHELGGEFSSLPIDSDSGYQTSTFVADNTVDPSDTTTSIENGNWVASYLLDFTDPSYAAFNTGQGLVGGNSEVDLFKDDQSANAFLAKQLGDAQTFVNTPHSSTRRVLTYLLETKVSD